MQASQPAIKDQRRPLNDLKGWSDEDLFLACRAGDQAAFRALVERHLVFVQRLAQNILRDEAEAEDVAQETFVSAWKNRENWRPEARLTTWLYRIATNKAIDRCRGRRATPQSAEVITAVLDREAATSQPAPATEALERGEVSGALKQALTKLPANQRRALELFYFDDCEVAKICEAMSLSEQSVRALLKRGRQNLKHRLRNQTSLLGYGSGGVSAASRTPRR